MDFYLTLQDLMCAEPKFERMVPINRVVETDEWEIQLVGLVCTKETQNEPAQTKLLFLSFDRLQNEQEDFPAFVKTPKTKRQELLYQCEQEAEQRNLPIRELAVGAYRVPVSGMAGNCVQGEEVSVLLDFLQKGWKPQGNPQRNLTEMTLHEMELRTDNAEELFTRLETLSDSEKIGLIGGSDFRRFPIQKRMTIAVGKPSKRAFHFQKEGVEHTFWIENVSLFDLHQYTAERFQDPALLQQCSPGELEKIRKETQRINEEICPRGKFLPVIEYESKENIQLDFYAQQLLQQLLMQSLEPTAHSGDIVFSVRPDRPHGKHGFALRADVLNFPVDEDCKTLKTELLFGWEQRKSDDLWF